MFTRILLACVLVGLLGPLQPAEAARVVSQAQGCCEGHATGCADCTPKSEPVSCCASAMAFPLALGEASEPWIARAGRETFAQVDLHSDTRVVTPPSPPPRA